MSPPSSGFVKNNTKFIIVITATKGFHNEARHRQCQLCVEKYRRMLIIAAYLDVRRSENLLSDKQRFSEERLGAFVFGSGHQQSAQIVQRLSHQDVPLSQIGSPNLPETNQTRINVSSATLTKPTTPVMTQNLMRILSMLALNERIRGGYTFSARQYIGSASENRSVIFSNAAMLFSDDATS
jgi:hypothetical protein